MNPYHVDLVDALASLNVVLNKIEKISSSEAIGATMAAKDFLDHRLKKTLHVTHLAEKDWK
jgi:hypothetical protein